MPSNARRILLTGLLASFLGLGALSATHAASPGASQLPFGPGLVKLTTPAGDVYCAPGACTKGRSFKDGKHNYEGPDATELLVRLSKAGQKLPMRCDEGLSGDPACSVGALQMAGEQFYLPGDGCAYVSQRTNSNFRALKKYCEGDAGQVHAVHQPYQYVGLTSRTNVPLGLLYSLLDKQPFHVIKAGEFIEVLLADRHANSTDIAGVLVRDKFGIVGWVPGTLLGQRQCGTDKRKEAIENWCFAGD